VIKMLGSNASASCKQTGSLQDVLQFPEVSRPGPSFQGFKGVLVDPARTSNYLSNGIDQYGRLGA
tara:strand:- start:71 stop:265 length:195 start_codon:yes stop_codon:yes gene_type:complete